MQEHLGGIPALQNAIEEGLYDFPIGAHALQVLSSKMSQFNVRAFRHGRQKSNR